MSDVMIEPKPITRRKKDGLTATSYIGYYINKVYTNEVGNRIYFEDTTKSIPAFYFCFKTKQLYLTNGEVAKPSYIYKIGNSVELTIRAAKQSDAPKWVVLYLRMVTAQFNRTGMHMFYNVFCYKFQGPHHSVIERMAWAEVAAKAGVHLDLRYSVGEIYSIPEFTKTLPIMRNFRNLGEPYSPVSETNLEGNSAYLSSWMQSYEIAKSPYITAMRASFQNYATIPNQTFNIQPQIAYFFEDHGYDAKRLGKYLAFDMDHQGLDITRLDTNLTLLRDYASMTYDVLGNNKFDKYPPYLKTYHDIAMKNHRIKQSEEMQQRYIEVAEDTRKRFPHMSIPGSKYMIVIPSSVDDIIKEGANQHHCVASYASNVVDKKTTILFMRTKDAPQDSLITIEVMGVFNSEDNPMSIRQVKGFSNRPPTDEEWKFISGWCDRNKVIYF